MRSALDDFHGVKVFDRQVYNDDRGNFSELYNARSIGKALNDIKFVQDNCSISKYGVIRGFHYQLNPSAQSKLVTVIQGEVLDVILDLRRSSASFKKVFSIKLSAQNGKQLFIPKGFAHGFVTLSEQAIFHYKCDAFYNKEAEAGIKFDDPQLNVDWLVPKHDQVVSDKDKTLPLFDKAQYNFD